MSLELRLFPVEMEQDFLGLESIWKNVYGTESVNRDVADGVTHLIGKVGEEAVFAVSIESYEFLVRGVRMKSAAVGGVAVPGHQRSSGVGKKAMQLLNDELLDSGFDLACLYGFREPFYRNSGYSSCGWRWKVRARAERLPRFSVDLPVRQISVEHLSEISGCYESFVSGFSGSAIRTDRQFRHRLGKKPPTIYALGDPVEAYFWCDIQGFWDELELGEFCWSTRRGYENALGLIRSLGVNKSHVSWCEPQSSPFLARFADEGIEFLRHRPTMMQILNFESVFEKLSEQFLDSVSFEIGTDHSQKINVLGGGPPVSMSVEAVTQGIFGDPGFEVLDRLGMLGGDEVGRRILSKSFGTAPVTCMEFF